MGSNNSKTVTGAATPMGSASSDRNVVGVINGRGKSKPSKLSSAFCGCSSSRNPPAEISLFIEIESSFEEDKEESEIPCCFMVMSLKMGDPQAEILDNSLELSRRIVANSENTLEELPTESNWETNFESSASEIKDLSESDDDNHEETLHEISRLEDRLIIEGSRALEGRDYVPVSQPIDDDNFMEKPCSTSSTSFLHQQCSDLALVNTYNEDAIRGLYSTDIHGAPEISPEVALDSVLAPERLGDGHPHIVSGETETIDGQSYGSGTVSPDSGFLFLDSDELQADVSPSEELPSGLDLLWSSREQSQQTDGIVQVDIVAISSDMSSDASSDPSSWEARRRRRRMFWDVISRHSSRGPGDSSTIIFATDDSSYLESHDRWPFDSSDDLSDYWAEERYFRSRFHRSQRRRRPRSEIWDRLRFGLEASSSRNTSCPSGLHPDGMCSCDSILTSEESSTRTSISRIVMLTEALFEVLDGLHRQPIFPPLSPVSLPAPGSVVDSFPLKSHQKKNSAESEENDEQCYICLVEYVEGDQIRVLPCKHEYHMHCVDKWLKEIHGICPLCRGDVCDGSTEHSAASDPEIPSV